MGLQNESLLSLSTSVHIDRPKTDASIICRLIFFARAARRNSCDTVASCGTVKLCSVHQFFSKHLSLCPGFDSRHIVTDSYKILEPWPDFGSIFASNLLVWFMKHVQESMDFQW